MKNRIVYIWLLVVLILCNNVCVFATETTDNEGGNFEDSTVDETIYP